MSEVADGGPVSIGPEIGRGLDASIGREWLVTNGIGGYAFGTVAGVATRAYHGLLVAALDPPVGRTVLVAGMAEWVTVGGRRAALHAHEFADGSFDERGYSLLAGFRLDGTMPVFTYAIGDLRLERRIWMASGRNTTYVRYAVAGDGPGVELELTPLVTRHDHHELGHEADGAPEVRTGGPGEALVTVLPPGGHPVVRLAFPGGSFTAAGGWLRGLRHREESARGLDDVSDAFAIGRISASVGPGRPFTLVLTADSSEPVTPEVALAAELDRAAGLLRTADAIDASPFLQALVLAADQFLVDRAIPLGSAVDGEPGGGLPAEAGRTVIAGYPWFNDWGRDTMIALPGLCLATGRHDEAAAILRSFGRFVRHGLLPNNFPDRAGATPDHNTIDASLWYPLALRAHAVATGSEALVDALLPTVRTILDAHIDGTEFGIGMDPADGLLRGGADGVQLTWMDARVDGWVVTPRRGKPVEIEALWINALRIAAGWLVARGDADARGARYLDIAERAERAFVDRFWRPGLGYLADVVDGPDGDDLALRPNQLFALSLPHPLVGPDIARSVVDSIGQALAVPLGLRSLAPTDPAYRPRFQGDRRFRDAGYHQGTAWCWLAGPYAEAIAMVHGRAAGLAVLRPFEDHLRRAGVGSISEIVEPEPPFEPRGCPAQAWSVAEVLRTWRALGGT